MKNSLVKNRSIALLCVFGKVIPPVLWAFSLTELTLLSIPLREKDQCRGCVLRSGHIRKCRRFVYEGRKDRACGQINPDKYLHSEFDRTVLIQIFLILLRA